MEIGNELPGLKLRNLFIGGLLKKDDTVQAGFTGCMQVYSHKHTFTLFKGVYCLIHMGTSWGYLTGCAIGRDRNQHCQHQHTARDANPCERRM